MKSLYIHCGLMKSGSSFIQDYIHRNEFFFNSAGVCLPIGAEKDSFGNFYPKAYLLGEAMVECNFPCVDGYIDLLLNKADEDFSKYFVSSEYFLSSDSDFLLYFCTKLQSKFNLHFIVYFRELFDLFFSVYRQDSRFNKGLLFNKDYLSVLKKKPLSSIEVLEQVTDKIYTISYDQHKNNLIAPLCSVLNISPELSSMSCVTHNVNPSLGRNLFFIHKFFVESGTLSCQDLHTLSQIVANSIDDENFLYYDPEIAQFLYSTDVEYLSKWSKYLVNGDSMPQFCSDRKSYGSLISPEKIDTLIIAKYLKCYFDFLKK